MPEDRAEPEAALGGVEYEAELTALTDAALQSESTAGGYVSQVSTLRPPTESP